MSRYKAKRAMSRAAVTEIMHLRGFRRRWKMYEYDVLEPRVTFRPEQWPAVT